ncbi:hypothetical protein [Streptomyces sp. BA2]|uniref:hypothetical protein n=1 Tax=Streptomyces sp. BA2 TaxID=436595 RepID=UPI001328AEF8|nr:hypothetical protein [Streptomyces sp. BA2]MWA08811.1 hypothetical protein [Streptomyces sp. BA2]
MTSPADELRAAAETLRALATAASTDPQGRPTAHWDVRYRPGVLPGAPAQRDGSCALIATDSPTAVRLLHGGSIGTRGGQPSISPDHGRYAAAMDPTVGLALADLLTAVADNPDDPGVREGNARHVGCAPATCPAAAALAVARAINREQP